MTDKDRVKTKLEINIRIDLRKGLIMKKFVLLVLLASSLITMGGCKKGG